MSLAGRTRVQSRSLCRTKRSWSTWSANVAFTFGVNSRISGKIQGASRHSPSKAATVKDDWQMKRFTPSFCMAEMMFFVPVEHTGTVLPGFTPSTQITTSCPAIAASTWAGSKTSPWTSESLGCCIVSAPVWRSKAVTSCPFSSACSTRMRPVPPAAPKITSFIVLFLLCVEAVRGLRKCSRIPAPPSCVLPYRQRFGQFPCTRGQHLRSESLPGDRLRPPLSYRLGLRSDPGALDFHQREEHIQHPTDDREQSTSLAPAPGIRRHDHGYYTEVAVGCAGDNAQFFPTGTLRGRQQAGQNEQDYESGRADPVQQQGMHITRPVAAQASRLHPPVPPGAPAAQLGTRYFRRFERSSACFNLRDKVARSVRL